MKIFLFKILNFIFWIIVILTIIYTILSILLITASDGDAIVLIINGVVFFGIPLTIFTFIRFRLASTFDVKKYRAKERFKKANQRIKKQETSIRNRLSQKAEIHNIDPLISTTKKEIRIREKDITPHILEQIKVQLIQLRQENNVPKLTQLYDIIIYTKPDKLNSQLHEFLTERNTTNDK